MPASALHIGQRKQLFLDDYCIEELAGVRRHFHQAKKHPANPLLERKEWWESFYIQLYGNVLFDPRKHEFRMFYNAVARESVDSVCLAISSDGIHFERAALNLIKHQGRVMSNAVLQGSVRVPPPGTPIDADLVPGSLRLPTVLHAPDDPDPQRRYRMIVFTAVELGNMKAELRTSVGHGYSVFFSPDAIHWTAYERNPVLQGSDMCTCFYDPVSKEYIAFVKHLSTACEKFRRCVGISASKDFVNWGVVQTLMSADEIDDARVNDRLYRFRDLLTYDNPRDYLADLYGMTGFRYEDLRLGLIWLYDRSGDRPADHGGNDDGIISAQLVYSRDENPYGYWHRTSERYDIIPCGNEGEFDAGMVLPASTVIEVGDEIWFYYTGCDESHNFGWSEVNPSWPTFPSKVPARRGLSIGLATLRRDGFVSIYGSHPGGCLTTKLLTFDGENLEINADAEKGFIQVELRDAEGKAIPGFAMSDCEPFSKDEIRAVVRWKGTPNLKGVAGRPIRVAFHIETAKLYAFRFV